MKKELADAVAAAMAVDGLSDHMDQKSILDSQVTLMRLRPGAIAAILVEPSDESLCAPNGNGNCPFWLFRQSEGHFVLLLENSGEDISMLQSVHKGMHDLVMTSRVGHTPFDEVRTVLQFDGKLYKNTICSESITGGDDAQEIRIPPHPCGTKGRRVIVRK